MIIFNEPRTVRFQSVLRDMRRVIWGTVLIEDEASTACMAANGGHFENLQQGSVSKSVSSSLHQQPAHFRTTHMLPEKTSKMLKSGDFCQGSAATLSR